MPFEFKRLEIPDVVLIKPKVFEDERGFFMETYKNPTSKRRELRVSLCRIIILSLNTVSLGACTFRGDPMPKPR